VQDNYKIFSGSSSLNLAESICEQLGTKLSRANLGRFSDGEIRFEIEENVRGRDIFVIQSTCHPCNQNIMELLVMGDALRRASAKSLCAVLPYYGYARQDRKVAPRTAISAKLVADLITTAGYNRLMTVDLHAGQIQGFLNYPVDHLFGNYVLFPYLSKKYGNDDLCVVSPDAGGTERARILGKKLKAPLAIVDKRRTKANEAKALHLIGDVKDKTALIIDDMIDTGGTLCQAAELLMKNGAKRVLACATHGVFSGPAYERLSQSLFEEIIITDSIPLRNDFKSFKKLSVLSVAPMIAETIRRIQTNDSISALFEY